MDNVNQQEDMFGNMKTNIDLTKISHPNHYNKPDRKECIVEMRDIYGNKCVAYFCITNAYKYLYRAGSKDGNSKEQDIAKARWYFDYVTKNLISEVRGRNMVSMYTFIKNELRRNGVIE